MAEEDRWGDYPSISMANGIVSVLSTPMIVAGKSVGVLNLYGKARQAFSEVDQALAWGLAGQASVAVTAALRSYDEVSLTHNLRIALSSRATIDQAIGIVMAQRRCDAEQAFAALRVTSQRRNTKLRDVATGLINTVSRS